MIDDEMPTITDEEIEKMKEEAAFIPIEKPWMHGATHADMAHRANPKYKSALDAREVPTNAVIDEEAINATKSISQKRPPNVSPSEFYGPKKLSHKAHLMAYLAACGFNNTDIAKQMNMHPVYVSRYMATRRMREMVEQKAFEMFGKNAQSRFMKIIPRAVEVASEIMEDTEEKGSVRADVAFKFMDRALGRPNQSVEHNIGSVRTLIEKFDEFMQHSNTKAIDVTPKQSNTSNEVVVEEVKENETDEIDTWVNQNL